MEAAPALNGVGAASFLQRGIVASVISDGVFPRTLSKLKSANRGKENMNIEALLVQLISGIVGGNVGGSLLRSIRSTLNLGFAGSSIAGLLGGGLIGYVLTSTLKAKGISDTGGISLTSIVFNSIGPALGGAVVAIVAGLIKAKAEE